MSETYKYNQAECNHQGKWDDAMFGKTCLDCGFNTLANDHGMYGPPLNKPKSNKANIEFVTEAVVNP